MEDEREWDVKRIIVGIVVIAALLGVGYLAKVYVLDKRGGLVKSESVSRERDRGGEVAGEQEIGIVSEEEIKKKIDTIKKDISNLKPEDVTKQEPIKKILQDLDTIKSETQKQVEDSAKQAICEQAKRIFCSQ